MCTQPIVPVGRQAQTACVAIENCKACPPPLVSIDETRGYAINNAETPSVQPGWYIDPWNRDQLRYFDGHQWTGNVASAPSARDPGPTGPADGGHGEGYPLGHRVLRLRAIPQHADIDVACSVEDERGMQIASIRSVSKVRFVNRDFATISFGLLNEQAVPLLYFTRFADMGSKDRLGITDTVGQELGQLRRSNTFWQGMRSSQMDMALECGSHLFGRTRVCVEPNSRFAKIDEPIYDVSGTAVASVRREWRYVGTVVDFYDYTLECVRQTGQPMATLLLATVFAHYLYDRLAIGGPLESIQRFGHQNRF